MSASVSQIDYWRGATSNANNADGSSGAVFLSYDMFLGLSVLGGFLALDHLYLRSPLTFLAKLFVNIFFFGVWWLYDASQAIFNTDVIKVFGVGIPGLGPKGIAAGVLANDVPDQKHASFFFYAVALIFGGLFGLDSFLVGDKESGFIRLVSLLTIIFAVVSVFWWIYNMVLFFFKTKDVTDAYPEYFGSPSTSAYSSFFRKYILPRIPILGPILSTIRTGQTSVPGLQPVASAVQAVSKTADTALSTVKQGFELGKTVVESGTALAGQALTTVDDTAKAAASALSLVPSAASLTDGVTTATLQKAMAQSGGSGNNDLLSYVLMGTLGFIAVSGFLGTYLRSNKNGTPSRDDSPPEPRVLRKPDQEKPTHSP